MDERELTDAIEKACGGIEQGFDLLLLWSSCNREFPIETWTLPRAKAKFEIKALLEGYSKETIKLFLSYMIKE